jgi:hypothetical protein
MITSMMTVGVMMAVLLAMALWATNLPSVKDALVKVTKALPNGAATVYSDGIDTGTTPAGAQLAPIMEWKLTAPALSTTELGDAATMKYSILMDTVDPIDGSSVVLHADILTQTGADGAGAAAAEVRFRLPSNALRILGFKAVNSAAGNASGKSATLEAVF